MHYQGLLKQGVDHASIIDQVYDLEVIARLENMDVTALKASMQRATARTPPWFFREVAAATIDSVSLDQSKAARVAAVGKGQLTGKIAVVRSGDFEWYFHQTPTGWKMFSQEASGETGKRINAEMLKKDLRR
jgi:hypothetical protein